MGQNPSRLSEHHHTLIVDASVAINLLGSGRPDYVLQRLGRRTIMVDAAWAEITRDPSSGKPAQGVMGDLLSRGLLACATLNESGFETFLELTAAAAPDGIGDGEAATIAYAEQISATALLDDRKAARIAQCRPSGVEVLHTLDLFASLSKAGDIPNKDLSDIVFQALRTARMRVAPDFRSWVEALIGPERVSQCSSLGLIPTGHSRIT
jgi:hypothetical protein